MWPAYSLNPNNTINATFIELHPDYKRLGKVYVNRYYGNEGNLYYNGYAPNIIGNCFDFWDPIISGQF